MSSHLRSWVLILACLCALVLLTIPLHTVSAELPPRPEAPTAVPPTEGPRSPRGGWIELRVPNATSQWTVVQWQDSAGAWHDVESWRGAFDEVTNGVGRKTWWVEENLFGAPNFRWVVYDPSSAKPLATSQPITLPQQPKQTVTTQVSLTP